MYTCHNLTLLLFFFFQIFSAVRLVTRLGFESTLNMAGRHAYCRHNVASKTGFYKARVKYQPGFPPPHCMDLTP